MSEEPKNIDIQEEPKSNSSKYIIILLLLALIGVVIGGGSYYKKQLANKDQLIEENNTLNSEYITLLDELNATKFELEPMVGLNEKLDSMITVRNDEIAKLKTDLKSLLASNRANKGKLNEARQMIENLRMENNEFLIRIDTLVARNNILTTENVRLTTELSAEKETTTQLTEENQFLDKKYKLGAVLKAYNFEVEGIKVKKSGKEVVKNKTKKVDQLKACWETGENEVIESGEVTQYLRLVDPAERTLYDESKGSGIINLTDGGEQVKYTKAATFNYDNSNKKVCVYWDEELQSDGVYKGYVYQSGKLVAKYDFTLK